MTPRSTSWGLWLGAQQHPTETGGSQTASSLAEVGTPAHIRWEQCASRDGVGNRWRAHLREEEGPTGLLISKGPRSPISKVLIILSTNWPWGRSCFSRAASSRRLRAATCCSASFFQAAEHEVKSQDALCLSPMDHLPCSLESGRCLSVVRSSRRWGRGFLHTRHPWPEPRTERQEQAGGRGRLRVPGARRRGPGWPREPQLCIWKHAARGPGDGYNKDVGK